MKRKANVRKVPKPPPGQTPEGKRMERQYSHATKGGLESAKKRKGKSK